jgi:2-iminobutanoate/2-iminopropanoate deaminase
MKDAPEVARTAAGPLLLAALALAMALPLAQGAAQHFDARCYIAHAGLAADAAGDAVCAGTLYIGGHLGVDPSTGSAPRDATTEARLLMEDLRRSVVAAGLQMDDVVALTVFSTDTTLDESFSSVFRDYFHGHPPAHAFVGAGSLGHGAHFEVTGVAVKRPHLQL